MLGLCLYISIGVPLFKVNSKNSGEGRFSKWDDRQNNHMRFLKLRLGTYLSKQPT